MPDQLQQLKHRLFGKKTVQPTALTGIMDFMREFGCMGELIGRDFEVRDTNGNVVFTIRQKPLNLGQLNRMVQEFNVLRQLEHAKEKEISDKMHRGRRK
jgi:hypothetical protein